MLLLDGKKENRRLCNAAAVEKIACCPFIVWIECAALGEMDTAAKLAKLL